MNDWDKILDDFARKCKGGAPDMTNPRHLALLRESLLKFGWKEFATNEFIGNLREGEKKYADNTKNRALGRVGLPWGSKGTPPEKEEPKGAEKKEKKPKKDKSLGEVDDDYYKQDTKPSDEDYAKSKPEQQKLKEGAEPTKLPDDILGSPSKVPKKYVKLVERLINSRYVNSTTPPITSMIDASGAGKIQAQAAEVLSMIGPTLSDDEMKNLMDTIRKHNSNLPQKTKKDGSSYKPPKYEEGSEPILSEDWLQSVENVRGGIVSRMNAIHGEGNWEIENGAWDLKGDVEAMGLSDYSKNKGFSTDMYLRVKTPDGSVLDEVSLKKNLDIFLSQPSVNAVNEWGLTKNERNEINDINKRMKTAKGKEKKELNTRKKEIMSDANSRIPVEANPKEFNRKTTESATSFYEAVTEEQHQQLQQLDENDDEYIKSLAKSTGQTPAYCKVLVKTMKNLKHPYSREELRQAMIDNGFASKKTVGKYQDKFSVMMMRTLSNEPINDVTVKEKLSEHVQIGKDFNKSFVENMVKEPYKTGVMNTIREKFPLKSLMDGEEKMSLGGVNADPEVMKEIFGTEDYDEIQEKLSIDGPDDSGEYQLVYQAELDGDVVPISTIAPRQRGIGYEPVVNLEMNLHPNMKEKLYCANKKIGRNVPEAEQYDKKYKCEV